ncbi:hypothetical protein DPX16_22370 [Anabarilius grahami]|uniref:Uncharacterized protein n=1 Tax=Anabarilius grahami TaxID=495550 RepID=A0A3N0YF22_ANAGA|nr:hypothetical protein DPX16_22370 [Anabarilius grahami]
MINVLKTAPKTQERTPRNRGALLRIAMYTTGETNVFKSIIRGISHVMNLTPPNICWKSRLLSIEDRLAALESKNCVEDTNSKKRRRVHSPKIALPVRHITRQYAGASGNLQTSRSCIAGGSCEAFSSESSEKKEAARSKTEFEDEVGLWKCATIDLMSDEEDGIFGGVSGWIVRPPSFRSQELTEHHAAVEIRGDSKVQGNAPQTSAKWTEFRQNAANYLQRRSGKQTFHGAVGFWASRRSPIGSCNLIGATPCLVS